LLRLLTTVKSSPMKGVENAKETLKIGKEMFENAFGKVESHTRTQKEMRFYPRKFPPRKTAQVVTTSALLMSVKNGNIFSPHFGVYLTRRNPCTTRKLHQDLGSCENGHWQNSQNETTLTQTKLLLRLLLLCKQCSNTGLQDILFDNFGC
jgi:hypothetical protein